MHATGARDGLRDVYWIGGGSGAGKSVVAARLAARHGLRVYSTDDVMADHAARLDDRDAPALAAFAAMSMDERWLTRSPEVMLETFHWFRGEGFGLVLDDLVGLAADGPVIAEGFRLLPELVAPVAAPGRAVWLLPTPRFRWAAVQRRGTAWDIAARTSDPVRANANLLERDALFTDQLRADTLRLGLPSIELDVGVELDDVLDRVATRFGCTPGDGADAGQCDRG